MGSAKKYDNDLIRVIKALIKQNRKIRRLELEKELAYEFLTEKQKFAIECFVNAAEGR